MTAARCFSPAEVEQWQPRARHYYHQAGRWSGAGFLAWIGERITVWCELTGADPRRLSTTQNQAFTAWLGDTCTCGGER